MKNLFITTALFFSLSFLSFGKDNSFNDIQKNGDIIIGLDDTFAPMGFRDEKGKIVGFDIDLSTEVSKRMGLNPVFKACDWDGIVFDLKSKKIDLIWNGLTITQERSKQIAFSNPYFSDDQIIIIKDTALLNLDDLKNKKIGVQMGSTSYFALKNSELFKTNISIRKYSTNIEALLDLDAGRTDAVVVDSVVGKYYLSKKDGFKIMSETLAKEDVGVGLRKEDIVLKEELNKALDSIVTDGTFDIIYKKWFGNN
ncbi:amino acid ABC transporter substrate-binding protein [uncultured Cetobacterium sp.]|uniref:amino acid ABC transporter substrate-binding protein n=1 Tax=uncultured Cetobacterium sp. TaxID=527638 RepID=UPI00262233D6|nr:amino acid ABC transporter substrate-binding protein [uncultured Cetobacterium sp.]